VRTIFAHPIAQTIVVTNPPFGLFSVTRGDPPFTIAASASSGLPVAFQTTTPLVCTDAGAVVTFVAAGACLISVTQAGNADYLPATTQFVQFNVSDPPVPLAPVINFILGAPGSLIVDFSPTDPTVLVYVKFTVTCIGSNIVAATGTASPITVPGLTPGATYLCVVVATGLSGDSPPSAGVQGTPLAIPLSLSSVVFRKTHGTAGALDIPVDTTQPLNASVSVEPRAIGSGHTVIFGFSGPVTAIGTLTATDFFNPGAPVALQGTSVISGNTILVTLTNIPNGHRAAIVFNGINGSVTASANVGFLLGDANGNRSVSAADVTQVKVHAGQAASTASASSDLNANGTVTAVDILVAKGRSGTVLP
jgi:hypothetical protein